MFIPLIFSPGNFPEDAKVLGGGDGFGDLAREGGPGRGGISVFLPNLSPVIAPEGLPGGAGGFPRGAGGFHRGAGGFPDGRGGFVGGFLGLSLPLLFSGLLLGGGGMPGGGGPGRAGAGGPGRAGAGGGGGMLPGGGGGMPLRAPLGMVTT